MDRQTKSDKLKVGLGQILMPTYIAETVERVIEEYQAGSLLFWNSNMLHLTGGARQMAELTNRLQEHSLQCRGRPLWLHGFIDPAVMKWTFRWQAVLPTVASVEEVEQAARVFGRRWRAVGLHNFPGPTVNRPMYETCIARNCAMQGNADLVSLYAAAMVRGITSQRCGTMAQHFPAHGATPLDSHTDFPVVDLPRPQLMGEHIRPYEAAFAAGCTSICTAHLACTALDPDPSHVATTSSPILTDFLRGELRYDGLILADAVGMKGFQKNGPSALMSVEAVAAGCDLICLDCPPPERTEMQRAVFESLVVAAGTPALPSSRLADAERRHLDFLGWLGILDDPMVDPDWTDAVFADPDDAAFLADLNARLPAEVRC